MDLISFGDTERTASVSLHIDNCLNILTSQAISGVQYDAIITDPPYEIGLHNKAWDATGISFSDELWQLLYAIVKPGGYIAAFAAPRLYHRLAVAAETAGFAIYPFLVWQFAGGLPKPVNVSELFDRDNVPDREIIGRRTGSGFTKANVAQGAQNRSKTNFVAKARHVSLEAQRWRGWYYGVNCLKPAQEPILLVQRPIAEPRAIDNLRRYGTGALNLGALEARHGMWPTTLLEHPKARKTEHGSNHPSVKTTALMEELCLLLCPPGGMILDPFAGTGSTGVAAQRCGFDCTLIEINPEMEPVIRRRLKLDTATLDHSAAAD